MIFDITNIVTLLKETELSNVALIIILINSPSLLFLQYQSYKLKAYIRDNYVSYNKHEKDISTMYKKTIPELKNSIDKLENSLEKLNENLEKVTEITIRNDEKIQIFSKNQ